MQAAKGERPYGDAHQLEHFDIQVFEQAADMAIFSFIEHDFEPRVTFALPQKAAILHAKKIAIVHADAIAQSAEQRCVGDRADLHVIRFIQMRLRRSDAGRPFGVVGKQQQSFAGFVETANRREPRRSFRQTRVDRFPAFLIRSRGHNAARLVEHEIDFRAGAKGGFVYFDAVFAGMRRCFRIAPQCTIQFHASRANQFRSLRARTIAKFGECPRQSYFFQFPPLTIVFWRAVLHGRILARRWEVSCTTSWREWQARARWLLVEPF